MPVICWIIYNFSTIERERCLGWEGLHTRIGSLKATYAWFSHFKGAADVEDSQRTVQHNKKLASLWLLWLVPEFLAQITTTVTVAFSDIKPAGLLPIFGQTVSNGCELRQSKFSQVLILSSITKWQLATSRAVRISENKWKPLAKHLEHNRGSNKDKLSLFDL